MRKRAKPTDTAVVEISFPKSAGTRKKFGVVQKRPARFKLVGPIPMVIYQETNYGTLVVTAPVNILFQLPPGLKHAFGRLELPQKGYGSDSDGMVNMPEADHENKPPGVFKITNYWVDHDIRRRYNLWKIKFTMWDGGGHAYLIDPDIENTEQNR